MRLKGAMLMFVLVFIAGCAGPPGIRKADNLLLKKDYLGAVEAYDQVLQNVKDGPARHRIENKFASAKISLADEYLMQAGEQFVEMGSASIPSLRKILNRLQGVRQWDDAMGRIGSSIRSYKKKIDKAQKLVQLYLAYAIEAAYGFEYNKALLMIDAAEKLDPESSAVIAARVRVKGQQVLYGGSH